MRLNVEPVAVLWWARRYPGDVLLLRLAKEPVYENAVLRPSEFLDARNLPQQRPKRNDHNAPKADLMQRRSPSGELRD